VDNKSLNMGQTVTLENGNTIQTPAGEHRFFSAGTDYAGMMLASTEMRIGVYRDQAIEIGREPRHPGLTFPDRRGQDNIRWCSGRRAAQAKSGGFTLDRALAGRRQAQLELQGETIRLTPLHARCPTYIFSAEDSSMQKTHDTAILDTTDKVIAGTTVIGIRQPE